jgi:hypothetical protein
LALQAYTKMLDEKIAFARDQFKLRTEIDLKKQRLDDDENVCAMSEMADKTFSKFTYNAAVITLWSFFEGISLEFAKYAKGKENNKSSITGFIKKFKSDNHKNSNNVGHNEAIEKYFEEKLNIELLWSSDDRIKLTELRKLRNHIVHENGDVEYLKENELDFMKRNCSNGTTMYVRDSYAKDAAELVVNVIRQLNKTIGTKYKQPLVFQNS